jgi:hypothetical protein
MTRQGGGWFGDRIVRHFDVLRTAENEAGRGAIRGRLVVQLLLSRDDQFVLMSTSLVSGRNRKPTTRLMAAMMIGYQRPE